MAAATIASKKFHAAGDMLVITYALTAVADTNTLDVDMNEVDNFFIRVATAGTPQYAGATISGRTITFDMSNTEDLVVTVFGR